MADLGPYNLLSWFAKILKPEKILIHHQREKVASKY